MNSLLLPPSFPWVVVALLHLLLLQWWFASALPLRWWFALTPFRRRFTLYPLRLGVRSFLPFSRGFATSSFFGRLLTSLLSFGDSSSPSSRAVAPPRLWVG